MQQRLIDAKRIVDDILHAPKYYFKELKPSVLPDQLAAVYAITDTSTGEVLYVGRTKNVRRRLYTNHLMGPKTNARLKKYLVEDPNQPQITDMLVAKEYLKANCYAQYVPEEDMVKRGQIEGLLSYMLNVRYIHEEH
jgi:hypothetical protein